MGIKDAYQFDYLPASGNEEKSKSGRYEKFLHSRKRYKKESAYNTPYADSHITSQGIYFTPWSPLHHSWSCPFHKARHIHPQTYHPR